MIVRSPETPEEFEQYFQLRYEILRKPWDQPRGSEKDQSENNAIHALALEGKAALGCGRLQDNGNGIGQVRFMAVAENSQSKGVGKAILNYLEKEAQKIGLKKIILDARENAVDFYLKSGYKLLEKSHLLFNEIQHFKMEKVL